MVSDINRFPNSNDKLEYIEILNKYDDAILEHAIKLINHIHSSQTRALYDVHCKAICTKPSKLNFYDWLINKSLLIKKSDIDILVSNGLIDRDINQPTDALYQLQDAIMQLMGWSDWKHANIDKIKDKLKEAQLHSNYDNEGHAISYSCGYLVTNDNYTNKPVTEGVNSSYLVTDSNCTDKEQLHSNCVNEKYPNDDLEKLFKDEFCLVELESCFEKAVKRTPYKRYQLTKFIKQLKHLIYPIKKQEFIDKILDDMSKVSQSSIDAFIKALKHSKIGWIDEYKGERDIPYLKLTYKFYETINDMELMDKIIKYDNEIAKDEKKEKIKEFIKKYLDDNAFRIDITEIDDLRDEDRIIGAYFRTELLNNPSEVIKLIYEVHDSKDIKPQDAPATPIDIIIAGLECVRSRKIEKVEDWGNLKNKLCLFKGDIVGVLHHKVRRPLLKEYVCNEMKNNNVIGCGYTTIRLVEPMENDKNNYVVKCPKCNKIMNLTGDAIGRKIERDITICLLQLQGTDELYKVYIPYTKNIYDLRAVDIVGILKTNSLGEYYIEGISINPRQNKEFSYEGFKEKVKEKGYDNALDYIKNTVFYEIKRITHKDNATIDNIITLEVLASSHIYWEDARDGNIKPETIDFIVVGGYGMGKSITINPLTKIHNTTENTIKINNANINNLISLQVDKPNLKFMKKGLIPLNHNRPIVFEEFMDWVKYIGDEINQLKDGKTSGYWKRERGGDNIAYMGVSPWVCFGNIPNNRLLKLWELLWKDKSKFEKELIKYLVGDIDDENIIKSVRKEILSQGKEYQFMISEILGLTIGNLRGMVDRIPLIYLLKPYSDDELDEIDDYLWELEKQKNNVGFIKNKEKEIYECYLFIECIKNKNIEFNYETFQAFKRVKRKLRNAIMDLGYVQYSDRLFRQIEYIAKAYAKLKFKDEVDIYDLDDAIQLWKKSALGVLIPYEVKREITETIGAYKEKCKTLKQEYEPTIIKEVGKEELQQQNNEDKEVVDTSNTIEHKDNEQVKDAKDRDYLELLKEHASKELKRHELLKLLDGKEDILNSYLWKGYIREVRMGLYKVDV